MQFLNWFSNQFDFKKATLSGCLDVIVVKKKDGTYRSTPFHLRFGRKFQDQKNQTKEVTLFINGQQVPFKMKLDEKGVAYFEEYRPKKQTFDESQINNSVQTQACTEPLQENYSMDFLSQSEDDGEGILKSSSEDQENTNQRWIWGELPQNANRQEQEILSAKQFQQELENNRQLLLSPKEKTQLSQQSKAIKNLPQQSKSKSFFGIFSRFTTSKENQQKDNLQGSPKSDNSNKLIIQEGDFFGNFSQQDQQQREENNSKKDNLQNQQQINPNPENEQKQTIDLQRSYNNNNNQQVSHKDQLSSPLIQQKTEQLQTSKNNQDEQQNKKSSGNKEKDSLYSQNQNLSQWKINQKEKEKEKALNNKVNQNFNEQENQNENEMIQVGMSLCGDQLNDKNKLKIQEIFNKKKVSFEQFIENPQGILEDKNLLVQIGDSLYPWNIASFILMSQAAFQQDIPEKKKQQLFEQLKKKKQGGIFSGWFKSQGDELNKEKEKEKEREKEKDKSVNQNKEKEKEKEKQKQINQNQNQNQNKDKDKTMTQGQNQSKDKEKDKTTNQSLSQSKDKENINKPINQNLNLTKEQVHSSQNLNEFETTSSKTDKKITSKKTTFEDEETNINKDDFLKRKISDDSGANSETSSLRNNSKFIKTLKPNQKILESLNLKMGVNEVKYVLQTKKKNVVDKNKQNNDDKKNKIKSEKLIEEECSYLRAQIFLWPDNAQIVISDIDGTITQTDIMGQIAPMLGEDWNHKGVASLYSNIKKNGYQILYLTARAIGQSQQTRNFLNHMHQENTLLPNGPVIMSPDGLVKSFKREVIYKRPEEFKTRAINDVRSLFSQGNNLYAGFGNKDTDAIAYMNCGVSQGKIFIINPEGKIYSLLNNTYQTTYIELNQLVDQIFPPLNPNGQPINEKFNNSYFWKDTSAFELDINELVKQIN